MKLFSEYIILEKHKNILPEDTLNRRKPIILSILYFLALKDIINTCDIYKSMKNNYDELYNTSIKTLEILKNKNSKNENEKFDISKIKINDNTNNVFSYFDISDITKNGKCSKFIKYYDKKLKQQITDFYKSLEELKQSPDKTNESLNINEDETEESPLDELKNQLETIKDVKFDNDKNLYKICSNLIDNFETFVDTIEDKEEKQKQIEDYNKKFKNYIEEIKKLNDSLSDNGKYQEEDKTDQAKEIETKVVESTYLKDLTSGIIDNSKLKDFNNVFFNLANEEIKKNPDNEDYLGLTIITIATSILKHEQKVSIDDIKNYLNAFAK